MKNQVAIKKNQIVKETEKAVCLEMTVETFSGNCLGWKFWFPKSQVVGEFSHLEDKSEFLILSGWIFEKKMEEIQDRFKEIRDGWTGFGAGNSYVY